MWLVAVVESSIGWPTSDTTVDYLSRNFTLRPESTVHYADVVTRVVSESQQDVEQALFEFCSMLAWVEDGSLSVLQVHTSSEDTPARVGRMPKAACGAFPLFVPVSANAALQLMFALYREALSVNSSLFSFFGLFKILNTRLIGDAQRDWINQNMHRLTKAEAVGRLNEIKADGKDVGSHIYNDLRMAVIHASENHNVNPDDPCAVSKLLQDLPLMRALAELFIEDAISVCGSSSP